MAPTRKTANPIGASLVRESERIHSLYRAGPSSYLIVLFLLARVVEENPPDSETCERLREELLPHRPWLGIVRQLLLRPEDTVRPLVEVALARLPEIRVWAADWI